MGGIWIHAICSGMGGITGEQVIQRLEFVTDGGTATAPLPPRVYFYPESEKIYNPVNYQP